MALLPVFSFPIIADSFQRANENPLSDGGNWGPNTEGDSQLQILNNQATGNSVNDYGYSIWTGQVPPNDQYLSVRVSSFDASPTSFSGIGLYARFQNIPPYGQAYVAGFLAPAYNDGVHCQLRLVGGLDESVDSAAFFITQNIPTIQVGDVLALAIVDFNLYVLINGKIVCQYTDATKSIDSGTIGGYVFWNNNVNDTGIIDLVAGSVSLASFAPYVDTWGMRSEYCLIDPTGASQNSLALFPSSPEANILASDDPKTTVVPFNGGTILFKNPA